MRHFLYLAIKNHKKHMICECVFFGINGLFLVIETILLQIFFDKATSFSHGDIGIVIVFFLLFFLLLSKSVGEIFNRAANFASEKCSSTINKYFLKIMHSKIKKISSIKFEDSISLEQMEKANIGKDASINLIHIAVILLICIIPYYVYMGVYLFFIEPLLAISIMIIFIPTLLTQFFRAKVLSNLEDLSSPYRRKKDYFVSCLCSTSTFKENRNLGNLEFLFDKYYDFLKKTQKLSLKRNMRVNSIELVMRIFSAVGYCAILFILFNAVMSNRITLGHFSAVAISLDSMYKLTEELICTHIGNVTSSAGMASHFLRFLNMEEREGNIFEISEAPNIELRNVSFKYPNSENYAVKGINLKLKYGQIVAVVGENGSGKSTLSKLISGLFIPTKGEVLIDGQTTETISEEVLFDKYTGVFQDYQRYELSLKDNVAISNANLPIDNNMVKECCSATGIAVERTFFPELEDTILSRSFGNTDLSGGQWQRVAIARCLYRNKNIVLLDEPTAAIDPLEENEILHKFLEISKNKTSIIITHRMGPARFADIILVMSEGKLVQMGSHSQLINDEDGEYSRLFRSQSDLMS